MEQYINDMGLRRLQMTVSEFRLYRERLKKKATKELDGGKENNMKNDGRCVNCGRVPVAGSTLCIDCLAACETGRKYGKKEIEELKLRISRQQKLIREIFDAFQTLQKAAGGRS